MTNDLDWLDDLCADDADVTVDVTDNASATATADVLVPISGFIAETPVAGPYLTPPRTYQYMVRGRDRADAQVLECCETSIDFTVHNEPTRSYLVFTSYDDYRRWHRVNPLMSLHEVIREQPQKLKFDIDAAATKLDAISVERPSEPVAPVAAVAAEIDADDELGAWMNEAAAGIEAADQARYVAAMAAWRAATAVYDRSTQRSRKGTALFNRILSAIRATFADMYGIDLAPEDFAFSDSTDATKFSRHIVISTYSVDDSREAATFTKAVLRILADDIRPLLDPDVNKKTQNFRLPGMHKVGSTRVKRCYHGSPEAMIITQVGGTERLPSIVFDRITPCVETPADVAEVVAMAAPYADGLDFDRRDGNAFYYRRMRPSHCALCDVRHDNDNSLFVTVRNGSVRAWCRRGDISAIIGRIAGVFAPVPPPKDGDEIQPRRKTPAQIPDAFSVERYCEPHLRPFVFAAGIDTLIIKSGMGTGKTKQLHDMIRGLPADVVVIFVSFRKSFSSELSGKLRDDGFVKYDEIAGQIAADRLIIQFESIDRLTLPVGRTTLLVLDESEAIVRQTSSSIGKDKMRMCWDRFQWLLTYSTYMIAMDAFAEGRTFALPRTRRGVHMHLNTWTPPDAVIERRYLEYAAFLDAIMAAATAAAAAPFVIASTCKAQADSIHAAILERYPHPDRIRKYTRDSTVEDRDDFNDVNAAWANIDILIYTSTITAGCSFEGHRFKRLFAYFNSGSCDAQTSIQMLGRVRDIESREHHVFIKRVTADLPSTMAEVEKVMATESFICDVAANPLGRPKLIDAAGVPDYIVKDDCYYAHAGNILATCRSRNDFAGEYGRRRVEMGVRMFWRVPVVDEFLAKQLVAEDREHAVAAKLADHERIAAAPAISQETANGLEAKGLMTADERASVAAFRLADLYGVSADDITVPFIECYDNPKVKAAFRNRAWIRNDISIETAILSMKRPRGETTSDDLNGNKRTVQCLFALDVMDGILPGRAAAPIDPDAPGWAEPAREAHALANPAGDYCSAFRRFNAVSYERDGIEARIDGVIADLRKHEATVQTAFGIRPSRLMQQRASFQDKLKLVNSVLRTAFAVSLKAVDADGIEYTLRDTAPFPWSEELGRYTVKVAR